MSTEENDSPEAVAPIGKGTRIRVVEGDDEGVEGEIFWWGRSKWGHTLRAGVEVDGGKEKVWVDAKQLRAIDEEGNELDPQPPLSAPVRKSEIEVRGIDVPYHLGRAITSWRLRRGLPKSKASSGTLRLDQLKAVEEAIDCRIPDAVLAFVIGGVGSTRSILDVVRYSEALVEAAGESPEAIASHSHIAFGKDGDKYISFARGAAQDDPNYFLADGDGAEDAGTMEQRLFDELGPDLKRMAEAFEVIVDYFTTDADEPEKPEEQWVRHKKFGRGVVLSGEPTPRGPKLTINFDDGETRKLLESFVEYE